MFIKKIKEIIEFIKAHFKLLIEFLKENSVHIHIKKKETSECVKTIEFNNLFIIFCILVLVVSILGIIKVKTIFFP